MKAELNSWGRCLLVCFTLYVCARGIIQNMPRIHLDGVEARLEGVQRAVFSVASDGR